jgi:hypothetical protein
MDTTESSAPHAHPSTEDHDDTVEAHYSGLERLHERHRLHRPSRRRRGRRRGRGLRSRTVLQVFRGGVESERAGAKCERSGPGVGATTM